MKQMKILYDIAAAIVVLVLVIPVCIYASFNAIAAVLMEFPDKVHDIFEKLYEER
jgi:hypothetical protein